MDASASRGNVAALPSDQDSALETSSHLSSAVVADVGCSYTVDQIVIHPLWGFVACLLQEDEEEETAAAFLEARSDVSCRHSRVWLAEIPARRAVPTGATSYNVPQGARKESGFASVMVEAGLQTICWSPGRSIPPLLLGIRPRSGELLACSMDVLRNDTYEAAASWMPVIVRPDGSALERVAEIAVANAFDEERALLCVSLWQSGGTNDSDRAAPKEVMLMKFWEGPACAASPVVVPLLRHTPDLPWSSCLSVEWLSTASSFCEAQAPSQQQQVQRSLYAAQPGEIVGQLAVWVSPSDERNGSILIHPLAAAGAADAGKDEAESEVTQGASPLAITLGDALRVEEQRHGTPLSLCVRDEWLYVLTSWARLTVWSLAGASAPHLEHFFTLALQPVVLPVSRLQPGSPSGPLFRPWNGVVGQSSITRMAPRRGLAALGGGFAAADREKVRLHAGSLQLHGFTSGALAFLVSGASDTEEVAPVILLHSRSVSEGDMCRVVDLRAQSLPLGVSRLAWLGDGAILAAGHAPLVESRQRLEPSVVAFYLPEEVLALLQDSAPCPIYHPSTLFSLVQSGREHLAHKMLERTVDSLEQPRPLGLQPTLEMPLSEFGLLDEEEEEGKENLQLNLQSSSGSQVEAGKANETATASALFADLPETSASWWDSMETEQPKVVAPSSTSNSSGGWRLPQCKVETLTGHLQTRLLPLMTAADQAVLLSMLTDVTPSSSSTSSLDLDESGRRYMEAFRVQVAAERQSQHAGAAAVEAALTSEDLCWALQSECQSTLVDTILECLGPHLDWRALCRAGVGLWVTDPAAVKKIIEALPRSIIKKHGREVNPQSVALWYALLGRQSVLAVLYKQQKQEKIADFLSKDLREEPNLTKATKNAFDLIRQRRFELACAFFVMAGKAAEAIDVCVRYADDWPLAALIAQHLQASKDSVGALASEALRRVLLADFVPLAAKAHDPWLAMLSYSRAGEYGAALLCFSPPYRVVIVNDDPDATDSQVAGQSAEESSGRHALSGFSGNLLRHSGITPGLPSYARLLRETILRKRLQLGIVREMPEATTKGTSVVLQARGYLARRQPLLSLPRVGSVKHLPWRTALAIGRALASLFVASHQPQLREDGCTIFSELAETMRSRLGLPCSVVLAVLSGVSQLSSLEENSGIEDAILDSMCGETSIYYSASHAMHSFKQEVAPLQSFILNAVPTGAAGEACDEEIASCAALRRLANTHGMRTLALEDQVSSSRHLAAVLWRMLPRICSFLQDPAHAPMPVFSMYLASQLLCAPIVSRAPSVCLMAEATSSQPPEFAPDLVHVVTAGTLALTVLLSLWSLTPSCCVWPKLFQEKTSPPAGVVQEAEEAATEVCRSCWTDAEHEGMLWQGLRVLLEHLQGDATEQRRLHRCGAIPSLLVSLFLQSSVPTTTSCTIEADDGWPLPPLPPKSKSSPGQLGGSLSAAPLRKWEAFEPSTARAGSADSKVGAASSEDCLRRLCVKAWRRTDFAKQMKELLHILLVELVLERLITALAMVSRKPASSGSSQSSGTATTTKRSSQQAGSLEGHWITTWHTTLLKSLRAFLGDSVRSHVKDCALLCQEEFEALPVAVCAPEQLLDSAIKDLGGGLAFQSLWLRLGGTRRLQLLLSHHPLLLSPGPQLLQRSTVLCRSGSGGQIRFVCSNATNPCRLAVHVKGTTCEIHIGQAARWFEQSHNDEDGAGPVEVTSQHLPAIAERIAAEALGGMQGRAQQSREGAPSPCFDPSIEFLIGGLCTEVASHPLAEDRGVSVAHFLRTLGLAAEPTMEADQGVAEVNGDASAFCRANLQIAASHPWQATFAAAAEDGSLHLWNFGASDQPPRITLPRPPETAEQKRGRLAGGIVSLGSAAAAAVAARTAAVVSGSSAELTSSLFGAGSPQQSPRSPTEASSPTLPARDQQRWQSLAWNQQGTYLAGVGSVSGMTLWNMAEANGDITASLVSTGGAMAKVTCATFVSESTLLAIGGRRAKPDFMPDGPSTSVAIKAWPFVSAGLCVVDVLSPPAADLAMHDAYADPIVGVPPVEYSCLSWAPARQEIICGTAAGQVRIFDMRQQKVSRTISAHQTVIRHAFIVAGRRLATLSAAAELKVWDLEDFSCLETRPRLHSLTGVSRVIGSAQALTCATMVSDHHLVTGGQDGLVIVTRI